MSRTQLVGVLLALTVAGSFAARNNPNGSTFTGLGTPTDEQQTFAGTVIDGFGKDTNTARPASQTLMECTVGGVHLTLGKVANGMIANGQMLNMQRYSMLYALLGTKYGGDGRTTFALPDLRAVAPNGMSYSICTEGLFPRRLDNEIATQTGGAALTGPTTGWGKDTNGAYAGWGADCTLGHVQLTAGNGANGWPALGQMVQGTEYEAVRFLLGNKFGGDGKSTSALPDLRAVTPNGLTTAICVTGWFPSRSDDLAHDSGIQAQNPVTTWGTDTNTAASGNAADCLVGEVLLTAGNIANGVPANGQLLKISEYRALHAVIGNKFGGDGQTTFALPDLKPVTPSGLTYSVCAVGIFPVAATEAIAAA